MLGIFVSTGDEGTFVSGMLGKWEKVIKITSKGWPFEYDNLVFSRSYGFLLTFDSLLVCYGREMTEPFLESQTKFIEFVQRRTEDKICEHLVLGSGVCPTGKRVKFASRTVIAHQSRKILGVVPLPTRELYYVNVQFNPPADRDERTCVAQALVPLRVDQIWHDVVGKYLTDIEVEKEFCCIPLEEAQERAKEFLGEPKLGEDEEVYTVRSPEDA